MKQENSHCLGLEPLHWMPSKVPQMYGVRSPQQWFPKQTQRARAPAPCLSIPCFTLSLSPPHFCIPHFSSVGIGGVGSAPWKRSHTMLSNCSSLKPNCYNARCIVCAPSINIGSPPCTPSMPPSLECTFHMCSGCTSKPQCTSITQTGNGVPLVNYGIDIWMLGVPILPGLQIDITLSPFTKSYNCYV